MKAQVTSFWEWQQLYSNDDTCLAELTKLRWPEGFQCPQCGHDHGWLLSSRAVYECSQCHHQCSVTAGTLFHASKVPLTKWFWAIYWVSSDKGSVSALRLTKLLELSWRTANKMLRKLRT